MSTTISILIAFPIDHTSLILADKLLSNINVDITFYIDQKIDNEFMLHARDDLQSVSDKKIKTTENQDWSKFEYVVLANLNVFPTFTDKQYAETISKLFRMHLADVKWKADVFVIMGQNFRGLIAANEIVKVYPVLKESVLVFSSIYAASVEVYGPAGGRHIPDRNGSFFNTGSMAQGEDKISFMRGSWAFGKFSLAEATALYNGIMTGIENNSCFETVGLVGKHPDETEAGTYEISRALPVFMSVASDQNMTDGYAKYLVACNNFFDNQYA